MPRGTLRVGLVGTLTAERLIALMAERGVTQASLVERTGITRSRLSDILTAARPMTVDELQLLSLALGASSGGLLRQVEDLVAPGAPWTTDSLAEHRYALEDDRSSELRQAVLRAELEGGDGGEWDEVPVSPFKLAGADEPPLTREDLAQAREDWMTRMRDRVTQVGAVAADLLADVPEGVLEGMKASDQGRLAAEIQSGLRDRHGELVESAEGRVDGDV